MNAPQRVVVLADVHVPENDARAWAAVVSWLRENHFDDLVLLGDFVDQESMSRHGGNPNKPKWKTDMAAAGAKLDELVDARPTARRWYVRGNHEAWLDRYIAEVAPELFGSLSLTAELRLAERGFTWVPEENQPLKFSNLWMIHGHQLRGGGMHRARKLALDFGAPGVTIIQGHDHQDQEHDLKNINGNCKGILLGCLRTLKPKWQPNENNGWVHGLGIFTVFPSGEVFRHGVQIKGGRLVWADRVYSGAA